MFDEGEYLGAKFEDGALELQPNRHEFLNGTTHPSLGIEEPSVPYKEIRVRWSQIANVRGIILCGASPPWILKVRHTIRLEN